jgi:hypothetical protein
MIYFNILFVNLFCDKMNVERGLSPPEQYEIAIREIQKLTNECPEYAPLLAKLKEEQKKVKKDWIYRGTSHEHRI